MFSDIYNLNYESSSIDWCEENYFVSNMICEFNNSWSSLLYIVFALFTLFNYSKFISNSFIYLIILSSILVGITSLIFHSTLSIGGQIMDESSIIMFIVTSDITLNCNYCLSLIFCIMLILSLLIPHYCRFILLGLGFFIIYNTVQNVKTNYYELWPHFIITLTIFTIAIIFWIVDMLFCDYLLFATHFIWHIFTSIALHNLIILAIKINNDNVTIVNNYGIFSIKQSTHCSPFNKIL